MIFETIATLLGQCDSPQKNFPSTDLYNEGWMLRLVLDWLSRYPNIEHDLSFCPSDSWYSEALLPSAFLARYRGDKLAESWTHADGVIGDFVIGASRDGDLSLVEDGKRLVVTEAKMFSKLSSGVTNAGYYNQAARNVACIAEVVARAGGQIADFDKLAFFVVAPASQINDGVFAEFITKESIESLVHRRVSEYEDSQKSHWFSEWFIPALELMQIREISWEELVELIKKNDPSYGQNLELFYQKCIEFNQFVPKRFG